MHATTLNWSLLLRMSEDMIPNLSPKHFSSNGWCSYDFIQNVFHLVWDVLFIEISKYFINIKYIHSNKKMQHCYGT